MRAGLLPIIFNSALAMTVLSLSDSEFSRKDAKTLSSGWNPNVFPLRLSAFARGIFFLLSFHLDCILSAASWIASTILL
jgi:hypothetical protein